MDTGFSTRTFKTLHVCVGVFCVFAWKCPMGNFACFFMGTIILGIQTCGVPFAPLGVFV